MDSTSTTGGAKTGLSSGSSGLIISTIADNEATPTAYTQAGSTIESITTLGTFAAPTATKCRFKEVDSTNHPGLYEIQLADARWAVSGARSLIVSVSGATGAAQVDAEIQLVAIDKQDAVRLGLSALPNAAAAAAGGLPTVGSGSGQISVASGTVTVGTNNDKTGYSLSGSQAFNNSGTWTGNLTGSVGSVSGNVGGNVSGSVGSVTAIVTANVTQMNGTTIDSKADENFNVFFGNAGATTTKVVDDVGTGAGGSSDWTATERNQIRYRLGLDGTTNTPTASPTLGTVSANVAQWDSKTVATPNVAGVPIVDLAYVAGAAANQVTGNINSNMVAMNGTTIDSKADENFNVFFGNAGATTTKVVDDVGTGAGGSSDWTTTEKNQIRYRLGVDGTTATPTATPALGTISANVIQVASQTANASGAVNFSNLDAAVSTRSTLVAADVWANTTRTLSSAGLDSIVIETGVNARQAISAIASACAGVASGLDLNLPIYKAIANAGTTRISATTDANGNRSVVTLTLPS